MATQNAAVIGVLDDGHTAITPFSQPLSLYRGDVLTVSFTCVNSSNQSLDLTAGQIVMVITPANVLNPTPIQIGGVLTNSSAGLGYVTVDSNSLSLIAGMHSYVLNFTDADNNQSTLIPTSGFTCQVGNVISVHSTSVGAYRFACRVLATTDITLNGEQTVDSVALTIGNRILLTGQTSGVENGPWIVQSDNWIRPPDFLIDAHGSCAFYFIQDGTHASEGWLCTNGSSGDVIGTDALTFAKFTP